MNLNETILNDTDLPFPDSEPCRTVSGEPAEPPAKKDDDSSPDSEENDNQYASASVTGDVAHHAHQQCRAQLRAKE